MLTDVKHLPDKEDAVVHPARDGLPWKKACSECAFRISDPQNIGEAYQRLLRIHDGTKVFYCLHRGDTDHRVCASYAAINKIRSSMK